MRYRLAIALAPLLGRRRVYSRIVATLRNCSQDEVGIELVKLFNIWKLNWEIGTRDSYRIDLQYLVDLCILAERHATIDIQILIPIITKLTAIIDDDSNYRIDNRMMNARGATELADNYKKLLVCLRSL